MKELLNSQTWNFAFYNGLGVLGAIVFILYSVFLWDKYKNKEFDWAFELAVGIWIATLSRVLERVYYGILRAFDLNVGANRGEILSPAWFISSIAIIGIIGLAVHTRTISKHSFGDKVFKGALWITLGTILGSLAYSVLL